MTAEMTPVRSKREITLRQKVMGLIALMALLGTQLLIGCGGDGGSSAGAQGQAPLGTPSSPGGGSPSGGAGGDAPSSGAGASFVKFEFPDGHRLYTNSATGEGVLVPATLDAQLVIEGVNANIGFLTAYGGNTWLAKCQDFRDLSIGTMIDDYHHAFVSGPDLTYADQIAEDLRSNLQVGAMGIGYNRIKFDFTSVNVAAADIAARQFVADSLPPSASQPAVVRALRLQDVKFKLTGAKDPTNAMSAFDGNHLVPGAEIFYQMPTTIDVFCDLLQDDLKLVVTVFGDDASVPLRESTEGVHPVLH